MAKVKIKNIITGAIKEVEKSIASDFVGTKKFVILEENKKVEKPFVEKEAKKIFASKEKDVSNED